MKKFRVPTPVSVKPDASKRPRTSLSNISHNLEAAVRAERDFDESRSSDATETTGAESTESTSFATAAAAAAEPAPSTTAAAEAAAAPSSAPSNALELAIVGLRHYPGRASLVRGAPLSLRRRPHESDENAVEAWIATDDGEVVQLGHVRRSAAAALAPLLDAGAATVRSCAALEGGDDAYEIRAAATVAAPEAALARLRTALAAREASRAASKRDVDEAAKWARRFGAEPGPVLAWDPAGPPRDAAAVDAYATAPPPGEAPASLAWPAFAPRARGEVGAAARAAAAWPPSDGVLAALGCAPADDAAWYAALGLRPPSAWVVAGPEDHLASSTRAVVPLLRERLDGAVHGASGCLTAELLGAVRELVAGASFWCADGPNEDQRVACYGAPMVIGDASVRLLRARPHEELTRRLCTALAVVYAVVHLAPAAAPGFNALIFSARVRGSGFWWHSDQVAGQETQTTLAPRQPVATLVLYEQPDADGRKDVVRWRPTANFDDLAPSLGCARTLRTADGMVHLQREGLQRFAKHAVLHAPGAAPRVGARVAVTARVARPDAWAAADAPAVQNLPEDRVVGPGGTCALPLAWGE